MPSWDDVIIIAKTVDLGELLFWGFLAVMVGLGLRKAYPSLKAFIAVFDAIAALPATLKTLAAQVEALATQSATLGMEVEKVREQVQNSHDTNLRDELDHRHDETLGAIRGMQKDIGRLDQRDVDRGKTDNLLIERLDKHLEQTERNVARIAKLEGDKK